MNKLTCIIALALLSCSSQKKQQTTAAQDDVERILRILSADDMKGRAAFTPEADKAATFIENEFTSLGLLPLENGDSFRQNFSVTRISLSSGEVIIDGRTIHRDSFAVLTDRPSLDWNSNVEVLNVRAGENLINKYREIRNMNKQVLVLVDPSLSNDFKSLREFLGQGRVVDSSNNELAAVFVLGPQNADSYSVKTASQVQSMPLFNVAARIPGRSRPNEIVIFSAHYDHIGVITPVNADSIANGADDDASGTTAVLALARHFKQLNNNERTLLFVAFAAEELGMIGSRRFSTKVNADSVVAMFNIEMIGKESKFGRNAAFISGYERSDFGQILQKNLEGTSFTFHPDPYPELNLFYRSDNATLAAMGVPAHTISTDQIDKDTLYHTVNDEFETLDISNIRATIQAIALSSRSIVMGQDTPKRIAKQEPSR